MQCNRGPDQHLTVVLCWRWSRRTEAGFHSIMNCTEEDIPCECLVPRISARPRGQETNRKLEVRPGGVGEQLEVGRVDRLGRDVQQRHHAQGQRGQELDRFGREFSGWSAPTRSAPPSASRSVPSDQCVRRACPGRRRYAPPAQARARSFEEMARHRARLGDVARDPRVDRHRGRTARRADGRRRPGGRLPPPRVARRRFASRRSAGRCGGQCRRDVRWAEPLEAKGRVPMTRSTSTRRAAGEKLATSASRARLAAVLNPPRRPDAQHATLDGVWGGATDSRRITVSLGSGDRSADDQSARWKSLRMTSSRATAAPAAASISAARFAAAAWRLSRSGRD